MAATQEDCSLVTSGKKHINGVDLYYEQRGTGKHALLMCPGSLGCTQLSFDPELTLLNKERFTIVTWDPRGYGRSRPPARDFSLGFLERDADDAVDLMKALGFDKFSVIGWSAGGITSLIAAAKNPNLINKVVAWGGSAVVTPEDVALFNACKDVTNVPERERIAIEEVYGDEAHKLWSACMDAVGQCAEQRGGSICMEFLPLISCPTLILHGENDEFVPKRHAEVIHKGIKGSRLQLMPGNHGFHMESPEEFTKIVADFLEE